MYSRAYCTVQNVATDVVIVAQPQDIPSCAGPTAGHVPYIMSGPSFGHLTASGSARLPRWGTSPNRPVNKHGNITRRSCSCSCNPCGDGCLPQPCKTVLQHDAPHQGDQQAGLQTAQRQLNKTTAMSTLTRRSCSCNPCCDRAPLATVQNHAAAWRAAAGNEPQAGPHEKRAGVQTAPRQLSSMP